MYDLRLQVLGEVERLVEPALKLVQLGMNAMRSRSSAPRLRQHLHLPDAPEFVKQLRNAQLDGALFRLAL